jgi:ribosomal protein S18 acetylase RimI-like enzyme
MNFDKNNLNLIVKETVGLELRSPSEPDLDKLRLWKNAQKRFFFHKKDISKLEQLAWYTKFSQRPYDILLMTIFRNEAFGCMGVRLIADHWDVYNVILGLPELGKKGYMSRSLQVMLRFARSIKWAPITLKVLKENPAVRWYERQGFEVVSTNAEYYAMQHTSNH